MTSSSFKEKTVRAKSIAIHQFMCSIELTQHAATHSVQKHFTVTEENANYFIVMMRMKLQRQGPNDILNMDQMHIPYSYHSDKMLEAIGSKSVQQRSSTSETKCITIATTVTVSGKMLTPFLIFKGARNGRIARVFVMFPVKGKYACHQKAWMDKEMMNVWIDVILQLWRDQHDANNPSIQPSLLILDAYRVHQMGLVLNRIQSMGIEIIHIPEGCTYLYHHIDVRINKPIKTCLCEKWEDWMTGGEGIQDGVAKEPSRKVVVQWLFETYTTMPETIGRNAWMNNGF
jgi:hypothetical protein